MAIKHGDEGHHDGIVVKQGEGTPQDRLLSAIGVEPTWEKQHLWVCPTTKQHFRAGEINGFPTETTTCCEDGHYIVYE